MSFWLHDGHCKSFVKKISTRARLCSTIILIGCLFIGWSTLVLFPLYLDIQREDSAIDSLKDTILIDQQFLNKHSTVDEDYDRRFQDVAGLINKIACIQDGLDFIVAEIPQHNLLCKEIIPELIDSHGFYNNHFFSIKVKGYFDQLVAFLMSLDNANFGYSFESCEIVRWKKGMVKMNAVVGLKEVVCTL